MKRRWLLVVVVLLAIGVAAVVFGRGGMTKNGPVVTNELAWWQPWASAGLDASVGGVLEREEGCLFLSGQAVVWPSDTEWDEANAELHLRGGAIARLGDTITGGGGSFNDAGGDLLAPCRTVAGDDEVTTFNQDDKPTVQTGP